MIELLRNHRSCAALDEWRLSLLARDPVIAEKHHRNEKAYLDKVVGSHNRAPAWTISEPLFNHGGLAIVGRKTSKIEQPSPRPTSGSAPRPGEYWSATCLWMFGLHAKQGMRPLLVHEVRPCLVYAEF
jgi:hypothetical protein